MSPTISLMPHAVCWKADPRLIWTMVVTNLVTFLSYLSICLTLLYLVRRTRKVIQRDWAYFVVGFALFIVACGSTHIMEVVTTWIPIFWLDADTNIITAALSAYVAFMLIRRASTIGFSINDYAARLANTELEKAQMLDSLLAAQKLEDWSRMSAVVTHEIGNPLEAIQNLLYLIRTSEGVSTEVVDMARIAALEAERVITISRSTLSFFRQSTHPEPTNLYEAVESVKFLLDPLLHSKHLVLDIVQEGDLTVEAFPGETRQVLLNVIRNACEATTRDDARIKLALTGEPSSVSVVITDQGSGIDPAVLPTLFQFGMSTKGEQGNGMGLWTVRHILAKHGGDVGVTSELGEGTTFTLRWPRTFAAVSAEKYMSAIHAE